MPIVIRGLILLAPICLAVSAHADITKTVTLPTGATVGFHQIKYVQIDMTAQTVTVMLASYVDSSQTVPVTQNIYTLPVSDIPGIVPGSLKTLLEAAIQAKVPLFGGTPDPVSAQQ